MKEKMLRIEEVALSIGVSTKTIRNWYRFKRENPEHEFSKMLPDLDRRDLRKPMLWKQSDLWKLMDFKKKLPVGRNGIMGSVTQAYVKGGKNEEEN